ncbi:unnamed protein product [Hymenolepis diminuta]|uniref:ANTH domain-containing protein n=1 Tax=Hymenolepis diminuta TaxID=6216 RepID=A0A0R3SRT9_HYMDI|nr:unnamed protein product [Hymenolepis diminuta]
MGKLSVLVNEISQELKADSLRTAYSFAKSIIWKTIEHDFYLYVYSQLSTWLRSTYESANGVDITPQLQRLQRRLKSVIHTCIGLDLTATIPHYRALLNECQGCESGLDSVNFDEATIEQQTLQLLEQTGEELGQNIHLYDRLDELSRTGSLDQLTRDVMPTGSINGGPFRLSTSIKAPQAPSTPVKPSEPSMQKLITSTSVVEVAPTKSAPMPSPAEFPDFPGTESVSSSNFEPPTASVSRLTAQA